MLLMSHDDRLNNLLSIVYPHCEVEKTLQGGYCELSGKIGFKGLLLCERHAGQLEAPDRIALLKGITLSLELCLRSIPLLKNKTFSMLVLAQRAQAAQELTYAHEELRRVTQEEGDGAS